MCTVCGCGAGEARLEGSEKPVPAHEAGHHHHASVHGGAHHHHYGTGDAGASVPGMSQTRMIQLEQDILSKNNSYADANRRFFAERSIFALNLVSSPGSGKTALLVETLKRLKTTGDCYVIEGDQQTSNDADRIRETGVSAIQINTGKGCHLDGHMIGHAVDDLAPRDGSLIFIENVGNLVCPAAFDLGEAHKVAILSVTEGEDKPLKYPDMFAAADLMLLNKSDLLPHLDFDVEVARENALRVNPNITILTVSAKTGEGLDQWLGWIEAARAMRLAGHPVLGAAE
ncbi:hydrogenase nickel incorporation protein HypB [Labrenzia sp. VG12]|uniref:hydrogenase nickel incorporation protein HypB n=1 Tax=Labrenzia sp. VG12 TaxID=2021862 RepID=UPI000B8BC620|nr:hydrogenase nickel incorporation protein HypB [Labrenzia sp. VG12]ASP35298.1 hydrogenase accessory protein HypB [Labrenzia sp. VG12]